MKEFYILTLLLHFTIVQHGYCDIYLHNPRGSNNRLNGRGPNRQNARRLFDSQNNNKGGYNVGENVFRSSNLEKDQNNMKYMMSSEAGTYLDIEWTNQHGCGDADLNCQIILQYMCQEHKESEIGSNFIPNRKRNGILKTTSTYQRQIFRAKQHKDRIENAHSSPMAYGLNEPWNWYDKCTKRHRNHGLFLAGQNLQRKHTSIYTRQNPGGTRFGYECPEERDYYPYWHPTDWIDIAVLADKMEDCPYYQSESFNVKPKGECMEKYSPNGKDFKHDSIYNNEHDCTSHGGQWIEYHNYLEAAPQHKSQASCEAAGNKWVYAYRSDDYDDDEYTIKKKCVVPLEKPKCRAAPYSRSNHLGNGYAITPLTYRWRLPNFPSQKEQRCFLRIRYNISTNDPQRTLLKNNPIVKLLNKLPLRLAINTAQFGRTFQDRSHMFLLTPRPDNVPRNMDIYNVNIRGKRGNIVQVYPAVEYDFTPKRLTIPTSAGIHLAWEGANTNPAGNAGQGTRGTDRNNFVQMSNAPYSFPSQFGSHLLKSAQLIHSFVDGPLNYQDIEASLASSGYYKTSHNAKTATRKLDDELNNASPSFAGIVMRLTKQGTYYGMCTRNNNFTNRSQKMRLIIKDKPGK